MTELQFDILDELYFVIDFENLHEQSGIEKEQLRNELTNMIKLGWVKCFNGDTELETSEIDFESRIFESYSYLATKKGLFAHNSK